MQCLVVLVDHSFSRCIKPKMIGSVFWLVSVLGGSGGGRGGGGCCGFWFPKIEERFYCVYLVKMATAVLAPFHVGQKYVKHYNI